MRVSNLAVPGDLLPHPCSERSEWFSLLLLGHSADTIAGRPFAMIGTVS